MPTCGHGQPTKDRMCDSAVLCRFGNKIRHSQIQPPPQFKDDIMGTPPHRQLGRPKPGELDVRGRTVKLWPVSGRNAQTPGGSRGGLGGGGGGWNVPGVGGWRTDRRPKMMVPLTVFHVDRWHWRLATSKGVARHARLAIVNKDRLGVEWCVWCVCVWCVCGGMVCLWWVKKKRQA